MKRTILLNAELSHLIATLGHGDMVVVGDAGLPVPSGVRCIDLALMQGIPSVAEVLRAVLSEMQVERVVIANEAMDAALGQLPAWCLPLSGMSLDKVSHTDFKGLTNQAKAVVRTGEFTPYANAILYAGVVF
ncbi:MAG: D-ribose pyranase [Burkholderiaceae bacterium]